MTPRRSPQAVAWHLSAFTSTHSVPLARKNFCCCEDTGPSGLLPVYFSTRSRVALRASTLADLVSLLTTGSAILRLRFHSVALTGRHFAKVLYTALSCVERACLQRYARYISRVALPFHHLIVSLVRRSKLFFIGFEITSVASLFACLLWPDSHLTASFGSYRFPEVQAFHRTPSTRTTGTVCCDDTARNNSALQGGTWALSKRVRRLT